MSWSMLLISQLLMALVLLAVLLWQKGWAAKKRQADIAKLLDEIEDRQGIRGQQLCRRLQKHYGLPLEPSRQSSERLISAEKAFLKTFIDQQLSQDSVAPFYETLCILLDEYCRELKNVSCRNQGTQASIVAQSSSASMQSDGHHGSDWGDVFD